jgi:superfamily II DNA or RNA helicase
MTDLRPYQQEAVAAFFASDGHATLAMAPGSGKTITACAIIKGTRARALKPPFSDPPEFRSLIIVPTLVLKDQWEKVLLREGIVSAEIVTYQWAAPRAEDQEFFSQFGIIIADEMHHLGFGDEFRRLLVPIYKAKYALGLTATPPQPKDGEENVSLRVLPVVYTYSFSRGQSEGYTAQIEIRPIPVQLTEEERKRYDELTDMIQYMISRYGIEGYVSRPYGKDEATGETIWGGTITTERRQLVALAEQKYEKLKELVDEVLPKTNGRVFIWSSYVEALEKAKAVLNVNGKQVAELVTGETPKKERRRIIEQAWGRDFPVLLVANVGSEGLDAPEAAVGIVLAGAKTRRETVQRLGRLLRPQPDKKAVLYLLFCERSSDEKMIPLFDLATEE